MVTYKFSFFFNLVEKNSFTVKVSRKWHRPFTKRKFAAAAAAAVVVVVVATLFREGNT